MLFHVSASVESLVSLAKVHLRVSKRTLHESHVYIGDAHEARGVSKKYK